MSCSNNNTLVARFWAKVTKSDGCWLWIGHTNPAGYGMIATSGGKRSAHRVSYELANGPVPEGLLVRHSCDNPRCVDPSHLSLGTTQDNVDDRVTRGRSVNLAGENHARSKLSPSTVQAIRSSLLTLGELSKNFEVSKSTVCKIRNNQAWRHV